MKSDAAETRREPIGIGIIGLGMASLPHARSIVALQQAGLLHCHAVWSPSEDRRRAFSDRWGLPAVSTVDHIIGDNKIDAVLLITPPDARASYVEALAGRGKHILMEKPVERTTAAARALVACADAASVQLGIVFQQRFRDASLKLARLVADGALGQLTSVRVEVPWWREQGYYDEPGRGTRVRDGGGVLMSQAIHSLDLMLALAGPVKEVTAVSATTAIHTMECEDFVSAGLRFANGAIGSLVATTAEYPGGTEGIVIAGTQGTARLSGAELSLAFRDGRREVLGEDAGSGGGSDPMDFPHHWHQRLIENFIESVRTGTEPMVTGRDSLHVHELIDALLASASDKRHVQLAPRTSA